jgi:hypothetical protein
MWRVFVVVSIFQFFGMASLSQSSGYTIAYIFIKTPLICKLFSNIFVTFASHGATA